MSESCCQDLFLNISSPLLTLRNNGTTMDDPWYSFNRVSVNIGDNRSLNGADIPRSYGGSNESTGLQFDSTLPSFIAQA